MTPADEQCASHFSPLLLHVGFDNVRPRRWVRGIKAPLREIFEIQVLKGATYSARWGFSLDFVPLCRNQSLRWKRTDRTADFDLCIDPIDEAGSVPDWCSFTDPSTTRHGLSALAKAAPRSVFAAQKDFDMVSSPQDMVRMFECRATATFKRFGVDQYVQTHLAWGLSLLAADRPTEAERHISRFCGEFGIDRTDPLLTNAFTMASAIANGSGA